MNMHNIVSPANNAKSPAGKILVVLHQETSSPGRVGLMLQDMGYELDICRPPLGQELPNTLADHTGVVMFGGPMSANDSEEYVKREIDWIEVPLRENKPFFGICLGAQMLVRNLGGTVKANCEEFAEIGYYPLQATQSGKQLMQWPQMVYQWHREGFSLPSGVDLLASGDQYPNQAIRYGEKAFGVQFHAELTFMMMNRWTTKAAERFKLHGAQPREKHFEGRYLYDAAIKKWLEDFLYLWLEHETV